MPRVPNVAPIYPGPLARPWERPQCESEIIDKYDNCRYQCSFRAVYMVNGVKLCDRHAGKIVLKALVK